MSVKRAHAFFICLFTIVVDYFETTPYMLHLSSCSYCDLTLFKGMAILISMRVFPYFSRMNKNWYNHFILVSLLRKRLPILVLKAIRFFMQLSIWLVLWQRQNCLLVHGTEISVMLLILLHLAHTELFIENICLLLFSFLWGGTAQTVEIFPHGKQWSVSLANALTSVSMELTESSQIILGAVSIRKTVLPGVAIPMSKIRRPNGRLIFNMEIAIRR